MHSRRRERDERAPLPKGGCTKDQLPNNLLREIVVYNVMECAGNILLFWVE